MAVRVVAGLAEFLRLLLAHIEKTVMVRVMRQAVRGFPGRQIQEQEDTCAGEDKEQMEQFCFFGLYVSAMLRLLVTPQVVQIIVCKDYAMQPNQGDLE